MKRHHAVLVWGSFVSLAVSLGCNGGGADGTAPLAASADSVTVAAEPESPAAVALLRRLRDRHAVLTPAFDPLANHVPIGQAHVRPVLPARSALPIVREGNRLRAGLSADAALATTPVAIELADTAAGGFHLSDLPTGVGAHVRLRGATSAPAEIADGHVLFRGGTAEGATLLHTLSAESTEDYLAFERAPRGDEVVYDVDLADGVAGLRLVGNMLELLDSGGAPRLHVAPPYIVGADGRHVAAAISVSGCAVDRNPVAPWGRPVTAPGAARCAVHVGWDGAAVRYPAVLDPSWSSTASMGTARAFAVSAVLSNRVLVAGGWNSTVVHASAELYDWVTRTWAATGSMAAARFTMTATRLNDGRILVAAGQNLSTDLATAEIYNPATGTFSAAGTMTGPRHFHTATLLASGNVLVAGGRQGPMTPVATARVYNVATNTWSATGNLLSAQGLHGAVRLASGQVLMAGLAAPSAQLYNPATGTWSATGALNVPRLLHSTTLLPGGKVLVVGGRDSATSIPPLYSAEVYDPAVGTWTRTGATPFAHDTHSATVVGGRVVVAGDRSNGLTVQAFDPTWGTWSSWPNMATTRYSHVAELMPNGKVLVAGGTVSGSTVTAASEELTPTTTAVTSAEYKLAAAVDPDVIGDRATEEWAVVYRPATLTAGTRYPLIVLLHGNHGTCGTGSNPRNDSSCQYTTTGTCPAGFVVTPNHLGYAYAANELASRGFIVVSINANLGITCGSGVAGDSGLNLARGRLVLKHLQRLSEWNRGVAATPASLGVSLSGHLDLTRVGLMGHSRGGEGQRAAYQQYLVAGSPWPARIVDPVTFRGIFEIGPVDGQTSMVLNPNGTNWNVILPMCDGDVSSLSGVKPFDRMMALTSESPVTPKSTYTVWGANHNYFNTEWQTSDSAGCTNHRALFSSGAGIIGSAEQRQQGFHSMVAFFTSKVGPAPIFVFNALFDPFFTYQPDPRLGRGYAPGIGSAVNRQLEDFINPTGTSTFGQANLSSGITITHGTIPQHDAGLRGATISWTVAGASTFFQTNWAASGSGFDLTPYTSLDLRLDRANDPLNPAAATDFSVQLVTSADVLSTAVAVGPRVVLDGPVGGPGGLHSMLQTLRIPLSAFSSSVSLASIRGARLTFSATASGKIYVANIRATTVTTSGGPLTAFAAPASPLAATLSGGDAGGPAPEAVIATAPLPPPRIISAGNGVASVKSGGATDRGSVELTLVSTTPFQARAELPVLQIGDVTSDLSSHPNGDLGRIAFRVSRAAFDAAANGDPVVVRYGTDSDVSWDFGKLDKARLDR